MEAESWNLKEWKGVEIIPGNSASGGDQVATKNRGRWKSRARKEKEDVMPRSLWGIRLEMGYGHIRTDFFILLGICHASRVFSSPILRRHRN